MLIRFNVGNFLSFKDVQEFSMLKGKAQNKSDRILENGKLKLLKFAALFGANAAGKSNLVSSIKYAQHAIVQGLPKRGKIATFKPDSSYAEKPSYFEFEIFLKGRSYSYGFEIMLECNQLVSEWLIELSPSGNDKTIFSRDMKAERFSPFNISDSDLANKFNVFWDVSKKNVDVLFLTEMNRSKEELYKEDSVLIVLKNVYDWFDEVLDVNYPDRPISDFSYFKDAGNRAYICKVIRSLGTGITDYIEQKSSWAQMKEQLPKELISQLEDNIATLISMSEKEKKQAGITVRSRNTLYMIYPSKRDIKVTTIAFRHGNEATYEFSEESDGTRRILDLVEILLTKSEKVYIIDEIDRSLHPQLTYKFIDEYLRAAQQRNVQLLITTHESRLLDFGLLRQDEIWIANKDNIGATELYSLDEYNVRFDKKVDKAYLEGRYGGVPIFSSIFPIGDDQ